MIARGFKPVGWVAAIGAAALGCYMLSLNVASERAELASIERQIVAAKQDIRALQTELGTRGRLQQLEHWNAEVLALSAPSSSQFLENEFTLARFNAPQPSFEDKAGEIRMASAEIDGAQPEAKVVLAQALERPQQSVRPLVRRASYVVSDGGPLGNAAPAARSAPGSAPPIKAGVARPFASVAPGPEKKSLLDGNLARELGAAAKTESAGGAGGR